MAGRSLPSLNALRAFEAAARHRSMTGAAAELGVTPGAVSRQVRELEAVLGTALFFRGPGGLAPTPAGESLAAGAGDALDRLAGATGTARAAASPRFRIGVYGFFASRRLLPLLPELRRDLPDVLVEWHTTSNPLELLPGRFDAVIAVGEPAQRTGLVTVPLLPITTVPVCAPSLLGGGELDFGTVPLLHTRVRPDDWRRWLDHGGFGHVPVRSGSNFESLGLAMEAAAAGLGAAVAIAELLGPDLARGGIVVAHPRRRPTRRSFVLQYESRLHRSPEMARLSGWLREKVGGPTPDVPADCRTD